MDMFKSLIRRDKHTFLFTMDVDVDAILITQDFGYLSDKRAAFRGYAHLLEHMTIKSNNDYLNSLEKRGLIFNAETQEYLTCYIFLDLDGSIIVNELNRGVLYNLFCSDYTEEELEIERKTIIEEHALITNTMGKRNADLMLGSVEKIKEFNLDTLLATRKKRYSKHIYIIMGNKNNFTEQFFYKQSLVNFDIDWYKKIQVLDIKYYKRYPVIELSVNFYSEFFVYCLRILFCSIEEVNTQLKIYRTYNRIKIQLVGNLRLLKDAIISTTKYKEHAYFRYYMNLSSFKYLYTELIYITKYLSPFIELNGLEFEKVFFSVPWEMEFYEKYFKS